MVDLVYNYLMKRVLQYIFGFIGGLLVIFALPVANANATGGFHVAISPVSMFLDLEAGTELTREFKIENANDEPTGYKIYASSYSLSDTTGDAVFDEETIYTELKDWISFYDGESYKKTLAGTIEANSALTITFKITVPDDPPAVGQYASIFMETTGNSQATEVGVGVQANARVGLNLITKTNAIERREAEIVANSIPNFLLNEDISANFGVKNTGNVHVDAFQTLCVENLFGELIYEYNGEIEGGKIVMPDKTIYAATTWEDSPWMGIYRITSTVTVPSLDLTSSESTIVVKIPPIILALIVVLLTIIIAIIIILAIKKHKIRKMRKAIK